MMDLDTRQTFSKAPVSGGATVGPRISDVLGSIVIVIRDLTMFGFRGSFGFRKDSKVFFYGAYSQLLEDKNGFLHI